MVDDIILSPEEQDERARRWLKDNGLSLVVGIAVGLGAIYGYNAYKEKIRTAAEQASALYNDIVLLDEQSSISDITDKVTQIKADHSKSPYAAKAALVQAKQLAVSDYDAAAKELQWVIDNGTEEGAVHTARIRLAKIYLVQDKLSEAQTLASHPEIAGFISHYSELQGDVAMRQDNPEQAKEHYEQALDSLNSTDAAYRSVLTLKINQLPIGSAPAKESSPVEGE